MNAIQFIQQHGVDKAREVVEGAPDSATHFMYDSELMMSDYLKHIPDVSEFSFDLWCGKYWGWKPFLRSKKRISLSDLKRLVESVDLVKEHYTLDGAIDYANSAYTAPEIKVCLLDAIADYKSIYGGEHV